MDTFKLSEPAMAVLQLRRKYVRSPPFLGGQRLVGPRRLLGLDISGVIASGCLPFHSISRF